MPSIIKEMKIQNIILLIFALILSTACTSKAKSENRQQNPSTVEIIRFDKDFYTYLTGQTKEYQNTLTVKYPELLPAVGRSAINMNLKDNNNEFFAAMVDYFDHPMLLTIYKDAISKFDDVSDIEKQISDVEQLVNQYIPGKSLPSLAFHVSGFKENAIVLEGLVSISTDKYLGTDYSAYQGFFSGYLLQQMQPKMLIRDYLRAWISGDNLINEETEKSVLTSIIDEGKILYTLSTLLPDYKKEDILGYTDEQMDWSKDNEKKTWEYMIKNSHLFSTDRTLIVKYTDESAFADKANVKLSRWIGWQIVNQYAKNTKSALSDILNTDARTILKNSKYNP